VASTAQLEDGSGIIPRCARTIVNICKRLRKNNPTEH